MADDETTPKQLKRPQSMWRSRTTAAFGSGAGETYYENEETGETVWERPDEYLSEEEEEIAEELSRMKFDVKGTLQDAYGTIDIIGSEATKERNKFVMGVKDVQKSAESRLEQLELMIQHMGTEMEWDNLIELYEYQMPRTVFLYWGEKTTSKARLFVAKIFQFLARLHPELYGFFHGKQWSTDSGDWVRAMERGVPEAALKGAPKSKDVTYALQTWMELASGAYSSTDVPRTSIPSAKFLEELLDIMERQAEELYLPACRVLTSIQFHELRLTENDREAEDPTELGRIFETKRNYAQFYLEALQHLMNSQHYPYDDDTLIEHMLSVLTFLFRNPTTTQVFGTNDLKVFLDFCILELEDLPVADKHRIGYLKTLHSIVRKPQWQSDAAAHKMKEILIVLNGVCDVKVAHVPEECRIEAADILKTIQAG